MIFCRRTLAVGLVAGILLGGTSAWYWQATAVDRRVADLLDEVRDEEPGTVRRWLIVVGLAKERQYRDPRQIGQIEEELVALGRSAVPALIAALRDEGKTVRSCSAGALGSVGDDRAVEPLLAALRDRDAVVRASAALALGRLRDRRALRPLISALGNTDSQVRECAALALADLNDVRAVKPLISALGDRDSHVRAHAALALAGLNDVRAIKPLEDLLSDDDELVRTAAKKATAKLLRGRAGS